MKRTISLVLVITTLALTISSCRDNGITPAPQSKSMDDKSDTQLEERVRNSDEFRELQGIREELFRRLVKSDVSKEELEYACESDDGKFANGMLDLSDEEAEKINRRIQFLSASLLEKFPELRERASNIEICSNCIDNIIRKWDKIKRSTSNRKDLKHRQGKRNRRGAGGFC